MEKDGSTVTMSLEEARDLIDELPDYAEELGSALDEAQGEVRMGNVESITLTIKITKE